MNSIRARVTLMLVGSILCVVVLSTLVMSKIIIDLVEASFRQGFVERISSFAPSLTFQDNAAVFHLQSGPGPGEILERQTAEVKESFRTRGVPFDVVVKKSPAGRQTVSVNMGPGWLTWPVPTHTPAPRVWYGIAGWMGLIALGVIGVALIVAHQTTKQLKFLETMAKAVGRDGILPRVREEGSAEIRATARALNMMGESLKNAVEIRMRLVAAAGHDLRTPMTRMRLRAEFLDDDERSRWLDDLDELDRIADSAIQLVREETVGKGTEPIRLDMMVRQICQELVLIDFPVQIAGLDAVTVRISPLAFTRALRNLVINAATHGGGAIVRVAASDATALVVIDDNGPGIPAKDMCSVFEPFFRVDPARRKHITGAGLGLAIAKEIIDRQGGTLVVENRKSGGLRQTLAFESELAASPAAAPRGKPLAIAISS
jgi:signal transduction histidine kinase